MNKILQNWFDKYKLHLLIWALFIFYETIVIGLVSGIFGHPLTYIAHYTAAVFLFYLHADFFLPWALANKKSAIWRLPFILALEISGFVIVSYYLDKILIMGQIVRYDQPFNISWLYVLKMLYRGSYFLGFATGYYYLITYIKEKRKTNELEKQHLKDIIYSQKAEQELTKAQNAFLKAQINPHFLFNTLDFIYHNIDASSPVAADAVIILTDMMRYAVDADKMGDFVRLGDEIEQAENLLYLSQIRKNHALGFRINYSEKVREIYLIPLVLLTLVENILKHGNLNEPEHEALINLYVEGKDFHIATDNLVNYEPLKLKTHYHTGLKNIEKRLKYAYGNSIEFNYHTDKVNHFRVHLSIPVEQLKAHDGSSKLLQGNGTVSPHGHAGEN
ncbi:sensor histidine kinase [Mucilaginibacter sp.]|jgi:two-component system LytT family sensor kinase|uniref:sensor histidine kinase n=1 Tax=Mucilaginibacter sp. TaxID=1882438 RepID=UPI00261062A3|nr:histidine kinase [Mucilaginibacter sp.]MDB4926568.1 Histidine kinase [Mucilaginibacter sp.]